MENAMASASEACANANANEAGASPNQMKLLIDKGEIKLIKSGYENYKMEFYLENPNINLSTIINNNMIKLIYDLNVDLFENVQIEKFNEYESCIFILFKDLFNDMGIPQYYYYFQIEHNIAENHFRLTPLVYRDELKKRTECVDLQHCIINYRVINPHQALINIEAIFPSEENTISIMITKIVCNIIYKIFNRVKQFIYSISI
jgi:hypothetical protein